jgi:hypothetical protein
VQRIALDKGVALLLDLHCKMIQLLLCKIMDLARTIIKELTLVVIFQKNVSESKEGALRCKNEGSL